jgi:hypothetical protein
VKYHHNNSFLDTVTNSNGFKEIMYLLRACDDFVAEADLVMWVSFAELLISIICDADLIAFNSLYLW